ncbi:LysR substrate-binding domain-containing protein [Trinickia acidisoli]|uniref:LysR substrate-binding domain-containing protein n=1 Tax=Trinickia acidisoli TaxID=2767482 RepID=UPI001A9016C5|nr:LysR substrate-binding domain-containing protein [Trinickia acidisoli]
MKHSTSSLRPSSRPPLASLEAVCVVAREGSFSAAALATGVTHGAISRRIGAVENWLGYPLFERHGRGVRLTPDGQRLVSRIDQAFSIIDGASDQWRPARPPRIVKVSVTPAFAQLWLFDRLAALEAGPQPLAVALDVTYRNADVAAGEADVAVRCSRGYSPGLDSQRLFPETLYPVAAPAIAAQLSARKSAQLLDWPLLHDSDLTGWRTWFAAQGIALKPRPQDRRFEDYNVVLSAAQAGLGIALAREPFSNRWLARSGLVRIGRFEVGSPLAYYVLTAKREARPEVLDFVCRLMQAAAQSASASAQGKTRSQRAVG